MVRFCLTKMNALMVVKDLGGCTHIYVLSDGVPPLR